MRRTYFVLCCSVLLAIGGCAQMQSTSCSDDYFKELRSETDDYRNTLRWFDTDCDNVCDGAILFDEDEQPVAVMPCEMADKIFNILTEQRKKMGV